MGPRLIEIYEALLKIENKTVLGIFGKPDNRKLKSCMTLFSLVKPTDNIFQSILDKYFEGQADTKTIDLLNRIS